jgi:hypothetical protein
MKSEVRMTQIIDQCIAGWRPIAKTPASEGGRYNGELEWCARITSLCRRELLDYRKSERLRCSGF